MKANTKIKTNFIVDAIGYLAFLALVSSGLIMSYVLLPGRDRAAGSPTTLLGYGRHDWGDIHFWAGMIFLAAIIVHLLLHWDWLVGVFRKFMSVESKKSVAAAIVVPALIFLAPLMAPRGFEADEEHGSKGNSFSAEGRGGYEGSSSLRIRGRDTLNDIEQMTGVPTETLLAAMNLPADMPRDIRLGELHEEYEFEMEQLREVAGQLAGIADANPQGEYHTASWDTASDTSEGEHKPQGGQGGGRGRRARQQTTSDEAR